MSGMSSPQLYDRVGPFETPADVATLEGFRAWASSDQFPETGKVASYQGRLYFDISPEYFNSHERLRRELTYSIETVVRERDLGELFLDGSWLTHTEAGVSNEPDLMFAAWETLSTNKLQQIPSKNKKHDDGLELRGTPGWVCEILSDSSERKDIKILRKAYFKAGIPEYWLLDARGDEIDFKLLAAAANGYEETTPTADGWRRSPVFEREFHLSRHRDRVGRWRYELKHR